MGSKLTLLGIGLMVAPVLPYPTQIVGLIIFGIGAVLMFIQG